MKSYLKILLPIAACMTAAVGAYIVTPAGTTTPAATTTGESSPEPTRTLESVDVVAQNQFHGPIGESWWQQLDGPVESSNPPSGSGCKEMWNWAHKRGGVDRGWSDVTVSIRAKKHVKVDVLSAEPELISSRAPKEGNTLLCVSSSRPYMAGEYELEHSMTTGFLLDNKGSYVARSGEYAGDLQFGELLEFSFTAFAHACDCTWRVAIDLLVDDVPKHFVLNDADNGKPFRTIAPPSRPGNPTENAVWCAVDDHGRLTYPGRNDCPIPVIYDTPLYH